MNELVYEDNFSRGSVVQLLDDNKEILEEDNNRNLSSVTNRPIPSGFVDFLRGQF
jgi:hypothetical protein